MGVVVKAESVKDFEFRLDSILSNNDLIYDYEASTKLLNIQNIFSMIQLKKKTKN